MPAGAIEHEHNLLPRTGPDLARELRQLHFKHRDTHRGGQMKDRASGGGMDKAHQVAPGKTVLHRGDRPLANGGPDTAEERL